MPILTIIISIKILLRLKYLLNSYCVISFLLFQFFTLLIYFMSVLVYNGEKFQRNKLWYLVFALIFSSVFILSLFNNNIIGALLIFFLLGGYFYYSTINNQVISIGIDKIHLVIWSKSYPRSSFTWYVIELYPKTQQIKNIVLLTAKWHMIYTFDDSLDHIRSFLLELDTYLPMQGDYHQTTLEKMSRKMKI